MGETSTGRFRTEGGAEIVLTLPLSAEFAGQQARGELVALDGDGTPTVVDAGPAVRPPDRAPKAEWVAFAVAQGADPVDAEGLTRAELVDLYGSTAD